jgi:hypothetical protein
MDQVALGLAIKVLRELVVFGILHFGTVAVVVALGKRDR